MALLNSPKAFDKALLSKDERKKLEPLVDYLNQAFDQIFRAFPQQLTFEENFRGKTLSVTAYNRQAVEIDTDTTSPRGIIVLKAATPIRSYYWTFLSTGLTQINFTFDEAVPALTRTAIAADSTYEIEESSSVEAGDFITVSGFGNKVNNGSFFVTARDGKYVTAVNPDIVNETKTSFTGDREGTKEVSIFILF